MKSKTGQKGKDAMKWMIASDLHGSAYYCKKMVEAFEREGADRLLMLGDLLYHGPRNDLPRDYAPKEVIPMLNGLKNKLCCVRGNCEAEVDQMVLDLPVMADYCILPAGEKLGPELRQRAVFRPEVHRTGREDRRTVVCPVTFPDQFAAIEFPVVGPEGVVVGESEMASRPPDCF